MIDNYLRDYLVAEGVDKAGVFNCPSYDGAIVGYTDEGSVIYDYELMVEEYLSENHNSSRDEAIEFINYNTIRSIPYMNDGMVPPIIMYPVKQIRRVTVNIPDGIKNEYKNC